MGCLYSVNRKEAMRRNQSVNTQPRRKYLPDKTGDENDNGNNKEKNLPEFTEEQKELVVESWKEINDDMDKVGIQMFMNKRKDARHKIKNVNTQPRRKYLPDKTGDENDNGNNKEKTLPEFTEEQKELVVESWKYIKDDMDKVGIQMLMKLFASHPDVQDAFTTFKGMSPEDLTHSNQLRSHAMRVMGTVDKCLTCINEPDTMYKTLHDLGARHVMYTAKVDYMDLIGPQFILAIQPVIGEKWNSEIEQAWSDLFKLIAHVMKAAMTFY